MDYHCQQIFLNLDGLADGNDGPYKDEESYIRPKGSMDSLNKQIDADIIWRYDMRDELGAVLIFDEITSGFRECPGGLHRKFDVKPDIAVFAKSIANGYPLGVVIGNVSVMESAQKTFIKKVGLKFWTIGDQSKCTDPK